MWWENQKLPLKKKIRSWGYLSYPELGPRQKDEGSRCCTPMQFLPESSNGTASWLHRKAPFKLAILLCWYPFVAHWMCVLYCGNLVSRVWGKHLRVMGEWKRSKLRPSTAMKGNAAVPSGREKLGGHWGWRDYGKERPEFQREAFEMIRVTSSFEKLYRKNVYSQWWTFFNFPINNK